uniref:F-box domain-containing protein n=1 Tax=Meloidogyne incognita TaxID=6306 RepID=A0A914KN68_MELIC
MSENGKIIEYDGIKYYLEEGHLYRLVSIGRCRLPVEIKPKKGVKLSLPRENLLDVFKFLDFNQLLSFQQTSFYFKNIVDKYGNELARKKYDWLGFSRISDLKFGKNNFVEIEPHLYDFELSKRLEQKWIRGIEESIPMFLTTTQYSDIDTVVCELGEVNYNWRRGSYLIKLPKFPKNLEEMAIARYLFKLIFNCAFEYFENDDMIRINPQMIDLLFDYENETTTTNFPLQIHFQGAELSVRCHTSLYFIWNYLVCNYCSVNLYFNNEERSMDILCKILTKGGNKFLHIIFHHLYSLQSSTLYNFIIKHIETSQEITKMVKKIELQNISGLRVSSDRAENIKVEINEKLKFTTFQIANKHNPKIKFSIRIKEDKDQSDHVEGGNRVLTRVAVIKRID